MTPERERILSMMSTHAETMRGLAPIAAAQGWLSTSSHLHAAAESIEWQVRYEHKNGPIKGAPGA